QRKIGLTLQKQDDLSQALQAYRRSLEIMETLTQAYPKNPTWYQDLTFSLDSIGDILFVQGKHAEALEVYQRSLAVREILAKDAPNNPRRQRNVSISQIKIGDA